MMSTVTTSKNGRTKIISGDESSKKPPKVANNKHDRKANWTIMIYMAVDDANGISESYKFLKELEEIKNIVPAPKVGLEENRNLRIFLQAYTNWNGHFGRADFRAKRFEVNESLDFNKPLEVPIDEFDEEQSMGRAEALTSFIQWCQRTGPAENYLLFLWGHGTGSTMFSLQESYERISNFYKDELTIIDQGTGQLITRFEELLPEILFKTRNLVTLKIELKGTLPFDLTLKKRETKYYDSLRAVNDNPLALIDIIRDRSDSQLSNPTKDKLRKFWSVRSKLDGLVEQEIRKSLKDSGGKIDILLIVGCCMQMVEFAYELKDVRKKNEEKKDKPFYYVASEELIYFDGYNYKDSFNALALDPLMDAETLAKRIVLDAPVKSTYTQYQKHALAIACVDLNKMNELEKLLNKFANEVLKLDENDKLKKDLWDKVKIARKQCRHFGEDAYTYSFIDLTWFFTLFYELVKEDPRYSAEFRQLPNHISKFLKEEYIVQPWIGHGRIPSRNFERSYGGHGVAIYFPESKKAHDENVKIGLGTPFEKNHSKGNGILGSETFPETNAFTEENAWYKMILKYREDYGEVSNYPLTGSLKIDEDKKKLLEDKSALLNSLADALLECDRIKTDVIPVLLLKSISTDSGDNIETT